MSKVIVTKEKIDAIADAIREKSSSQDTYTLDDMPTAIENIPSLAQTLADYIKGTVTEITSEYATYTRQLAFRFCNSLEKIDFPNCTMIQQNTFNGCSNLKNVNLPKVTTLFSDAFQNCINLEILNLPELETLSNGAFSGCAKLSTLIFKKNQVVYIGGLSNLFYNTPFYTNKTGGTLYVPQALITAYENDANWSIVLNYNSNNKILPIEGSIYE